MHLNINKKKNYHYLLLSIFWLLGIVIVNPIREFPLNDDFLYVMSVMELSMHGRFAMDAWTAVTIIIHILWGSLFASVFGFSFSILRISTLLMSLAGILVSYRILAEVFKKRNIAFLLALFIAFNPVYFNLSFTFMTDLTFYSMVVFSVLFYILSFEKRKSYYLYLATLFSILATLTRQIGLFVPLSALLTAIIIDRRLFTRKVITYFLHTLFILVVLISYIYWLKVTGRQGQGFRDIGDVVEKQNFILVILQRVVDHTGRWLAEMGLWFLPLALFFTLRTWTMFRRYLVPAGIVTLVLGVAIVLQTSHFPGGNVFYVLGLGPRTLTDVYLMGQVQTSTFLEIMVIALKALAVAGGLLVTWLMVATVFDVFYRIRRKPDGMSRAKIFSLLMILIYHGVFLASFTYFDRYGILLFVPLLILILPSADEPPALTRSAKWFTLVFLALMMVFSVAATRDYLSWNQARWDAAYQLEQSGVDPGTIDGGLEYIGWQGATFENYGIWRTDDYEHVLTFHPLEGYEVVGKKPYRRLMPFRKEEIFVLKKKTEE